MREFVVSRLTMVSLFTGAGGIDIGFEEAGFGVTLCVEMDPLCRKTLALNRPKWRQSSVHDATELTKEAFMSELNLRPRELSALVGGPPCQPFSKSSQWAPNGARGFDDPRARTVVAFFKVLGWTLPRIVMIENVPGFVSGDLSASIVERFRRVNRNHKTKYRPTLVRVNAADYGVPQKRERILIIAERSGKQFILPSPTHGPDAPEAYMTAWDAFKGLRKPSDDSLSIANTKWGGLLPSIPEGMNYLWHTPRMDGLPLFGWRTKYWNFLLKLAKNEPAPTVQASAGPATGPFHWENRRLTTRELARLQTFPDSWRFSGSVRRQEMQIGNAMPPALAELIALELRRQLLGERVRRRARLIPERRSRAGAPTQPMPVPTCYRHLEANHPPHPGTGLGPAHARRRNMLGKADSGM